MTFTLILLTIEDKSENLEIFMRINHKVLSIPPYISTSWKNILSIQSHSSSSIIITLQDGSTVTVQDLSLEIIQVIFKEHAKHVEETSSPPSKPLETDPLSNFNFLDLGNFRSMLEHNQQESHAPDLPQNLLEKVTRLTQSMGLSNFRTLPTPEPHCNCPHCQIARSMRVTLKSEDPEEEEISLEELSFKSWIIKQTSETLYQVTHPDNLDETFLVTLDSPIGCACGSNQCEHIQAVLSS